MLERQFERFRGAPWFHQGTPEIVMVGGSGGIGSWLTFFLTRAGFSPMIYDFDDVEEHNIGGQMFRTSDIGSSKVSAISKIIKEFCGEDIFTFNQRIDLDSPSHYFTFSAFDNMQARKDLFAVWKRSIPGSLVTPIFIDGRLEAEQLQIFCVTPDKIDEYEREHLFDDSDVEDAPCSMRQTTHSAAMIATHMVAFFTNHITNIYERQTQRTVPFYYEYFIPINLTEEYD